MLFNVEIPNSIVVDKDELTKRLYKVVRYYVNKKLVYESYAGKEDCIQDTIMVLLEKINMLQPEELENLNLERWIYNRMNSYVSSIWLGKLKRYRERVTFAAMFDIKKLKRKKLNVLHIDEDDILSNLHHQYSWIKEDEEYFIDYMLLAEIILEYKLDKEVEVCVLVEVDNILKNLGFVGVKLNSTIICEGEPIKTIVKVIADEYISKIKEVCITNE